MFFDSRTVAGASKRSMREQKNYFPILSAINSFEHSFLQIKNEDFKPHAQRIKAELMSPSKGQIRFAEAIALIREAARRTLNERMFDSQLLGLLVLQQGRIAEMKTGEGKTLTSIGAAFCAWLEGMQVHIITVNDYLSQRDAEWMQPVFNLIGLSVGFVVSGMSSADRQQMYDCDVVYATNNEVGFDYLRDNLRIQTEKLCKRGYQFCIIDEVDSILIDEARTPLIISGPARDDTVIIKNAHSITHLLKECKKDPETEKYPENEEDLRGDFKLNEKNKSVSFTQKGMQELESLLQQKKIITRSLDDLENFEYVHYVSQSLRAHYLYTRDVDYVVQEGRVEIVDEFTGRILKGRRYSDGLHQAIEAKEGITIEKQNRTLASITIQNFFKLYHKISGMTGTAASEEKEFLNIYGLDVVELPTNKPVIRIDDEDLIFISEEIKIQALTQKIKELHSRGQPILLGTVSIENSELLSKALKKAHIPHRVLNAKNHAHEAHIIAEAGRKSAVTIATNMAGRGTDIKLGGNWQSQLNVQENTDTDEPDSQKIVSIQDKAYEEWQQNYEEVKKLGGLYILGTERHESRRIDNQLRGRSGRQGDPGHTSFYLSLDDQLLKIFGSGIERIRSLMGRSLAEGEALTHKFITRAMERAQKNVENRNFEIRKHLLDYDSVINKQREIIYANRDELLHDSDLLQRIKKNLHDYLQETCKGIDEDSERSTILTNTLIHTVRFKEVLKNSYSLDETVQQLYENLDIKASLVGKDFFNKLIRAEYLKAVDSKWQEHLTHMEELRQATGLRGYAQKNPLTEYKLEAFEIFTNLLNDISISIIRKFVGLTIESIEQAQLTVQKNQIMTTQHTHLSQLETSQKTHMNQNQVAYARRNMPQAQGIQSTITRHEKIGRNAPCPCGSGKKYKHCHGRSATSSVT